MDIVGAYVLGRPMPFSSNAFTKFASVNLAGGSVKCCSGERFFKLSVSPTVRRGMLLVSLFSSTSVYKVKKPANFNVEPVALNKALLAVISTESVE